MDVKEMREALRMYCQREFFASEGQCDETCVLTGGNRCNVASHSAPDEMVEMWYAMLLAKGRVK